VSLIEVNKQKINQYLPALRSTSQHLNSIVNDILDDAKIEAGKLDFESLDFDLKLEIENVLSGFQFESQQKAVKLHLDFPSQISFLKSDPIRIKQILYNLIGNSLKFTEKGHVSLEIQLITEEEDHVNLNFKISDSGIGMTHDQIVKVLEPYAQAGANTSRQYGGTGLGMGIAIKLIEAFGGKLNMKSQVGIGTEMSFQLKLLKGVNSEMASSVETSLKGLNIILAEDDPVNRAILTEVLNARDVKLTVVKSGKELSKALLNVDFDLVISDVELEDKSGIEALIDFRKSGKQTPFLFISGDNLERHSSLNDQFNWQWLQKPIELNALLNCINAVISQSEFTIDLSLLEKTVGGDKDFMKELLNTISTTLPKEINALKEAVNIRDVSETRRILHKIRPSIDYLGIPELSEWRKNLHDSELTESVSDYVISCNIFSNHVLKSVFQLSYYK
jgi:DNA-binding response OmpR family regulator